LLTSMRAVSDRFRFSRALLRFADASSGSLVSSYTYSIDSQYTGGVESMSTR
jgi:hypothetical protein